MELSQGANIGIVFGVVFCVIVIIFLICLGICCTKNEVITGNHAPEKGNNNPVIKHCGGLGGNNDNVIDISYHWNTGYLGDDGDPGGRLTVISSGSNGNGNVSGGGSYD